jgi:prephenate dehydrogenase
MFEPAIVISGVGLIGGSIAAAVRRRSPATRITGVGRSQQRLNAAKQQGLLDEISDSPRPGQIPAGSLGVVCLPVEQIAESARELLDAGCTAVTDAGSVKATICAALAAEPRFVGAHPIAGSEQSGFEHALGDLFEGRICVLCPEAAPLATVQRVASFWEGLGMKIRHLTAIDHDRILALTSHLPHVMASVAAGSVTVSQLEFAGTGFRDTTRIAAGASHIWTSILLENREACLEALEVAGRRLDAFRHAIADRDADRLATLWEAGAVNRRQLEVKADRET